MTVEVEQRVDPDRDAGDVSGVAVTTLLDLVQSRKGDAGVAQVLALAGENRTFATLGDTGVRSSVDATVALLKKPGSANLIDPTWRTEGSNVADLVKYMTKYSILFGPVQKGQEDAYLGLNRGLAGYLFTLRETAPQKK